MFYCCIMCQARSCIIFSKSACSVAHGSALSAAARLRRAALGVFERNLFLFGVLGGVLGLGFAGGGVASALGRPTLAATGEGLHGHVLWSESGQQAVEDSDGQWHCDKWCQEW